MHSLECGIQGAKDVEHGFFMACTVFQRVKSFEKFALNFTRLTPGVQSASSRLDSVARNIVTERGHGVRSDSPRWNNYSREKERKSCEIWQILFILFLVNLRTFRFVGYSVYEVLSTGKLRNFESEGQGWKQSWPVINTFLSSALVFVDGLVNISKILATMKNEC